MPSKQRVEDLGKTLLERNNEFDKASAACLLNESLEICGDLGMRLLVERVVSLQERPAAQPTRAPAYPDGLTQGEV